MQAHGGLYQYLNRQSLPVQLLSIGKRRKQSKATTIDDIDCEKTTKHNIPGHYPAQVIEYRTRVFMPPHACFSTYISTY
jgi:hypothetical protein